MSNSLTASDGITETLKKLQRFSFGAESGVRIDLFDPDGAEGWVRLSDVLSALAGDRPFHSGTRYPGK